MSEASILFVDDDPNVLSSLRRMMHPMRAQWRTGFANGGAEALEVLKTEKYDIVISDMRMPEMNGAQLLREIKALYPEMIRVILSGHSERGLAIQTTDVAHQFFNKPCGMEELTHLIDMMVTLRKPIENEAVIKFVNEIVCLPSIPAKFEAITSELASDHPSSEKVVKIVESDPAMIVSILRLANSGFFGLSNRITSVQEAIGQLSVELLHKLSQYTVFFSRYENTSFFSLERYAARETKIGRLAKRMAESIPMDKHTRNLIPVAATLCNVGAIPLILYMPEKYKEIMKESLHTRENLTDLEKRVLGTTHAAVGAYMMCIWGFEDQIVEAIAYHHHPELAKLPQGVHPLPFVHVANSLVPLDQEQVTTETDKACSLSDINEDYLKSCGMYEHLSEWKDLAKSIISEGK